MGNCMKKLIWKSCYSDATALLSLLLPSMSLWLPGNLDSKLSLLTGTWDKILEIRCYYCPIISGLRRSKQHWEKCIHKKSQLSRCAENKPWQGETIAVRLVSGVFHQRNAHDPQLQQTHGVARAPAKLCSPGEVSGHSHVNLNIYQAIEICVSWASPIPGRSKLWSSLWLTNTETTSILFNPCVVISVYSSAFFLFLSFPYKFSSVLFLCFCFMLYFMLYCYWW